MLEAPVFIVCVADIRARVNPDGDLYVDEESDLFELKRVIRDTAIATENILLDATNYGLGTCWVGWYTQKEMRPVLGIPEDKFVIGVITLGYPDESPEKQPRKKLKENSITKVVKKGISNRLSRYALCDFRVDKSFFVRRATMCIRFAPAAKERFIETACIDTPLGLLTAAAVEEGICFLDFADKKELDAELRSLAGLLNAGILPVCSGKSLVRGLDVQLKNILRTRREADLALAPRGTDFQLKVWEARTFYGRQEATRNRLKP